MNLRSKNAFWKQENNKSNSFRPCLCVWFLAPGAWMLLGIPGLICSYDVFYEWAKMKKTIGVFNEEEEKDAED